MTTRFDIGSRALLSETSLYDPPGGSRWHRARSGAGSLTDVLTVAEWGSSHILPLWRLVALVGVLNPNVIGADAYRAFRVMEDWGGLPYTRALECACEAVRTTELVRLVQVKSDHRMTLVTVESFFEWAYSTRHEEIRSWVRGEYDGPSYQAGSHATKAFRALLVMSKYYLPKSEGGTYKADDPSSCLTVKDLKEKCEAEGLKIKESVFKAIYQILTPDDLPPGRRPNKSKK